MNTLEVADRKKWRTWLRENHRREPCVWLVYYKKHTGKPSISYEESVEEAICFGWIDGLKRRIDDQRYAYRFTPRKPGSKWSPTNIRRAENMIAAGLMARAGQAAFDRRVEYDDIPGEPELAPEIRQALRANRKAWKNYQALPPGARRQYAGWLMAAKRTETRMKRIREAKQLLAAGKKLGMK